MAAHCQRWGAPVFSLAWVHMCIWSISDLHGYVCSQLTSHCFLLALDLMYYHPMNYSA